MFLDFFYNLRGESVPCSTGELIAFLESLRKLTDPSGYMSLDQLYRVGRLNFAKDLKFYDSYDLAFSKTFGTWKEQRIQFRDILFEWLEENIPKHLSDSEKLNAPNMSMEEVIEELKKRLAEQKERHDGGSKWVGTSGTSPFGNSGFNPNGISIGGNTEGEGSRSGVSLWNERKYKAYREDEILDTRSIQLALKELRFLKKEGRRELHVDKTIDRTCENGGEIELVEERERKNSLRLVLIMDIGGSMTPHSDRVSKLFSASRGLYHFKEVHNYFFHNIFHEYIYSNHEFQTRISLKQFEEKFRKNTKLIFVGDAYMAPYELMGTPYNPYAYHSSSSEEKQRKAKSGLESLKELVGYFPESVWLNPEPKRFWGAPTIEAIEDVVPMFPLTIEGLRKAVKRLI
ncbi:VWA domain-containing protein [Leptospira sp. 85282-16]|uniref:VWA domain-containing protein n=1 Tax=Leptospira montravelensis TaxID=2484961 RepID=A0ABY2LVI0_9LEPT|nr:MULTISPECIES: VWA domain-containing protein [Leptospira]MCT8332495.1 VWA domain-containing protein [Leptospira sp. 85282-16]TGK83717.1 VWA domain-containing protein [Leptospira montravelensis]TGL05721.1 VWA domain-containing protein [Leptospira montravelensis]